MGPLKLYFAGCSCPPMVVNNVKNRLTTFAYPKETEIWANELAEQPTENANLIVDSGAFSAWNKGKEVNIGEYIEYCHKAMALMEQQNCECFVVNLDVIPGKVGETGNLLRNGRDIINKAAAKGFKNMKTLMANGIKPMHVFHQGETWKWLDKMLEYCDYIGISPANDLPTKQKYLWMRKVFDYLEKNNVKVKTHGFAVMQHAALTTLPWTSCDAATWILQGVMGNVSIPAGGYLKNDFSVRPSLLYVGKNLTEKQWLSRKYDVLRDIGCTFPEVVSRHSACILNIRYTLALEKWINENRKTYQPLKTLF